MRKVKVNVHLRNLLIGNQFAAEDSPYLALNGVTHVVNTAGTVSQPDCVRPNQEHLKQLGIELLNLEVIFYKVSISNYLFKSILNRLMTSLMCLLGTSLTLVQTGSMQRSRAEGRFW